MGGSSGGGGVGGGGGKATTDPHLCAPPYHANVPVVLPFVLSTGEGSSTGTLAG